MYAIRFAYKARTIGEMCPKLARLYLIRPSRRIRKGTSLLGRSTLSIVLKELIHL